LACGSSPGILAIRIARHFGDQAPTVGTERVIGIVMLFVGALFFLMYFETFNYVGDRAINSLADLNLQLEVSWRVMRAGGGAIGAQLYYFMVANFSEFGAFFIMIAWIIIGVMLTLSLSAAEVAMIVIGSVRNFQDAQKQRSARRAIQQAEAVLSSRQKRLLARQQRSRRNLPRPLASVGRKHLCCRVARWRRFHQVWSRLYLHRRKRPKPSRSSISVVVSSRLFR